MAMLSRTAAAQAQRVIDLVADAGGSDAASIRANTGMSLKSAGLDSLDSVELTMRFEEEFAIAIDDGDMEQVKTIRDLQLLVAKKVDAREKKVAA